MSGYSLVSGDAVLVRFYSLDHQTADAYLIRDEPDADPVWLPKRSVLSLDEEAREVYLPLWLAEDRGLDYE